MTNEEKAREIIKMSNTKQVYDIVDFPSLKEALREDLMQMAEWKDEEFAREKQALIDKACEWLRNNINDYYMTNEFEQWFDEMFDDFKKAMKGE